MKLLKRITKILTPSALLLSTLPALAVRIDNPDGSYFISKGDNSFQTLLVFLIRDVLLPLAGGIAVLFIIIGGYQYLASGADGELAEQGKKTLQNAIIGLVIIIISYVVVRVIIGALDRGIGA